MLSRIDELGLVNMSSWESEFECRGRSGILVRIIYPGTVTYFVKIGDIFLFSGLEVLVEAAAKEKHWLVNLFFERIGCRSMRYHSYNIFETCVALLVYQLALSTKA